MNIVKLGGLPAPQFAAQLEKVKVAMKQMEDCVDATELLQTTNVTHHFEEGVYGRELLLPKGTIVVSRVHKTGSINVISKGVVEIVDTNGWREVRAPATFTSPKGTHRIVIALEETVWTGVHHSTETDEQGLFESLTSETYEDFLDYLEYGEDRCGQQPL